MAHGKRRRRHRSNPSASLSNIAASQQFSRQSGYQPSQKRIRRTFDPLPREPNELTHCAPVPVAPVSAASASVAPALVTPASVAPASVAPASVASASIALDSRIPTAPSPSSIVDNLSNSPQIVSSSEPLLSTLQTVPVPHATTINTERVSSPTISRSHCASPQDSILVDETGCDDVSEFEEIFDQEFRFNAAFLESFTDSDKDDGSDCSESEDDVDEPLSVPTCLPDSEASRLYRQVSRKLSKSSMKGILSLYGKSRFTLLQYDHMVDMIKEHETLPSSSTLRRRLFPYLVKKHFVHSKIVTCETKSGQIGTIEQEAESGAASTTINSGKRNQAVVILPSEWARLDIRCIHTLRDFICIDGCRCHPKKNSNDIRIESSNRVKNGARFMNQSISQWVNHKGLPTQADTGSSIRLHTFHDTVLPQDIRRLTSVTLRKAFYRNEDCMSFDATLLCTCSVVVSEDRSLRLQHSLFYNQSQMPSPSFIADCKRYLVRHYGSSIVDDNVTDVASSSPPTAEHAAENIESELIIRPGDIVSFLKLNDCTNDDSLVVFVNRFWLSRLHNDRQFILLMHKNTSHDLSHFFIPSFGVPQLLFQAQGNEQQDHQPNQWPCHTTGKLADGTTFYKYRVLLYADDFNARSPLFPKGSVGGVYLMPIGLSVKSNRSQSSVRTVSLTPQFVSTNYILNILSEDLVDSCLNGFLCIDAFGSQVRCFLEVVGYVADYPASSAALDVKGHNAFSPCTHCSFHYCTADNASKYSYTGSVNSSHSAHRRTQDRFHSLHRAGFTDEEAKMLGLKAASVEIFNNKSAAPLLKFASMYNSSLYSKRLSQGHDDNLYELDGYTLNVIAPDHLLTGLMKGILLCTFLHIDNKQLQDKFDILLKCSLLRFGFQSQNKIFKNNKLVSGLTLSMIYALFSVLPTTLESLSMYKSIPTRQMIQIMHKIYTLGFWWPDHQTDGNLAYNFVHGKGKSNYINVMRTLCTNFVKSVDRYAKKYPSNSSYVDRPNTHRLIELAEHTLHLYGHLAFICELVFEAAHQPLKFFLSRNNTSGAHIYAVQMVLARDWFIRIHSLWSILTTPQENQRTKQAARLGLLHLFGGHDAEKIDWTASENKDILDLLHDHIKTVLSGTIGSKLKTWYSEGMNQSFAIPTWKSRRPLKLDDLPPRRHLQLRSIQNRLHTCLCARECDAFPTIQDAALFDRGIGSSNYNAHERIGAGDTVQVLLNSSQKDDILLQSCSDGTGDVTFFVVGSVLLTSSNQLFLAVHKCTTNVAFVPQVPDYTHDLLLHSTTMDFFSLRNIQNVSYLRLDKYVRKVEVLHNCNARCKFNFENRTVSHSKSTLEGGSFLILSRSLGYPPRRS